MTTLEQIIEDAKQLPPHELQTLRDALDKLLAGKNEPLMTEEEFARHLAAKGIVTLPEPMTDEELAEED